MYALIGIEPTFRVPLEYTLLLAETPTGFDGPQPLASLCAAILGEETLPISLTFLTDDPSRHDRDRASWRWLGFITRPSLALHAILSGILVAHSYSYGEKHHTEAIYTLFLFCMALAPCNRAYSVDAWLAAKRIKGDLAQAGWGPRALFRNAYWPILVAQILLCSAYFMAGLCKMKIGGLDWFNGDTLQGYIFEDVIRYEERYPGRELPVGQWVCRQRWLCVLASYGTVIYEVAFPIVLFIPRLAPLFVAGGIALHVGIDLSMSAAFYQYLVLYMTWFPWERFFGKGGEPTGGSAVEPEPQPG